MNNGEHSGHPKLSGTGVQVGGRTLSIPGYTLLCEIGKGANATVFEALDVSLARKVAVKIWNARGLNRAQSEASKIASMNHPLIVSTYFFGRVDDHPYCVMELVQGISGKEWNKKEQPLSQRFKMWGIYTTALEYIHGSGAIHGDPHLGNILVATGPKAPSTAKVISGNDQLSAKLADAGTSEFWTDRSRIEEREADLIFETASRLFERENFSQLWRRPHGIAYKPTLAFLQAVPQYLYIVHERVDWDQRGLNSDSLADLIIESPFFDLSAVCSQVKQTGVTTEARLMRRINARLRGIRNILEADHEISEETTSLYENVARQAIQST